MTLDWPRVFNRLNGARPFATLRVTTWPSVILSGAKNLSGDVSKMARVYPEQSEGMSRHILETVQPKRREEQTPARSRHAEASAAVFESDASG